MRRHLAFLFGPLLLAGCPGPDPGPRNPPRLFLALVGNNETMVQLVPEHPEDPY